MKEGLLLAQQKGRLYGGVGVRCVLPNCTKPVKGRLEISRRPKGYHRRVAYGP